MEVLQKMTLIKLNVPEFFEDPIFMAWFDEQASKHQLASWHGGGKATEFSDAFLTVHVLWEPSSCEDGYYAEGSNSDMPEPFFKQICQQVWSMGHWGEDVLVWLTNLEG